MIENYIYIESSIWLKTIYSYNENKNLKQFLSQLIYIKYNYSFDYYIIDLSMHFVLLLLFISYKHIKDLAQYNITMCVFNLYLLVKICCNKALFCCCLLKQKQIKFVYFISKKKKNIYLIIFFINRNYWVKIDKEKNES